MSLPLKWTFCSSLRLVSSSWEEKLISRETALHLRIFLGTLASCSPSGKDLHVIHIMQFEVLSGYQWYCLLFLTSPHCSAIGLYQNQHHVSSSNCYRYRHTNKFTTKWTDFLKNYTKIILPPLILSLQLKAFHDEIRAVCCCHYFTSP